MTTEQGPMITEPPFETERFSVDQLLRPEAFPHPVAAISLMETHISWVILTGDFAYKIKKPVRFDFVDYSTLEKRRINCQKEIELNQRYASGIYLDVVPVWSDRGTLRIGSPESADASGLPAVEYAVRMKQFDQEAILARRLQCGTVPPELMDQFAVTVAEFHRSEPAISVESLDIELDKIHREVTDNFRLLKPSLAGTGEADGLARIAEWSEHQFARLRSKMAGRIQRGCLRQCHGDMHLNNILLYNGRLIPFDGIEFNRHLQTIDPLNEIAFTYMDLMSQAFDRHAARFLNAYLESADDYEALDLFRFFAVYRALVRAKVEWINWDAHQDSDGRSGSDLDSPWTRYLRFAERAICPKATTLQITFGFSGSGKSTRALQQVEKSGAIRLRSDVFRQRLAEGLQQEERYSAGNVERVYRALLIAAEKILTSGYSVVVDATFLDREHRLWFRHLAERLSVSYGILACDASESELRDRIRTRSDDPSEATIEVLEKQLTQFDPLDQHEQKFKL